MLNRLKKLSPFHCRPRRPVGDRLDDLDVDLAEVLRRLAIDRLREIVARRVVALGRATCCTISCSGESFMNPTFSDSDGTPVLMKLY